MLADLHVYATLPAADLERARHFYAEKWGLTPEREAVGGLFYRCGGETEFFYSNLMALQVGLIRKLAGSLKILRPK